MVGALKMRSQAGGGQGNTEQVATQTFRGKQTHRSVQGALELLSLILPLLPRDGDSPEETHR